MLQILNKCNGGVLRRNQNDRTRNIYIRTGQDIEEQSCGILTLRRVNGRLLEKKR